MDIEPGGKRTRRSYTIASTPTRPECLEITVKREEMGLVSRYLHNEAIPGCQLRLSAPAGKFTFTGKDRDSIVLIAAGVGITPMMSVVRYLTDQNWECEIFMILSFRNLKDFIFLREIQTFGTVKRKPKPDAARDVRMVASDATVTFASEGKSAPLPPDEPILDVADSIGLEIDNACRSGTCGSCKVKLLRKGFLVRVVVL